MINKLANKKAQEKNSNSLICIITVVISLLLCYAGSRFQADKSDWIECWNVNVKGRST